MALVEHSRARFRRRVEAARSDIERAAKLIASGDFQAVERNRTRARAFTARMARGTGAERIQGPTADFLPTPFLDEGAYVSRAVGRITLPWGGATEFGTGVIVAPGVVLTNQHVLRSAALATNARIEFDVEEDYRSVRRPIRMYLLDPAAGFVASPEIEGLDYALIALGTQIAGEPEEEPRPACPLLDSDDRHAEGWPVNIIQHPGGRPRVVALRENRLYVRADDALLYDTDTEPGSSGAPVFNDRWEMIALHHYGEPQIALAMPLRHEHLHLNEGIRVSAIVRDLKARRTTSAEAASVALIDRVLAHAATSARAPVKRPMPRRADHPAESASRTTHVSPTTEGHPMNELRISLPPGVSEVSLTLRMGSGPGSDGARVALASNLGAAHPIDGRISEDALQVHTLRTRAESRNIDRNYENRQGFDGAFLDAMPIDLPTILRPRAGRIAPLLVDSPDGILHYQHFSLAMHRTRRMAMLTATNIDGESYLKIDRTTGEIKPLAAEREVWYTDPRIADEYLVLQAFYSEWSHLFDRGHLTRRNDPTWGDETTARRAETDTFHFTNCTPQHWFFNQNTRHWQGIERYVLENGLYKTRGRLSVLQGPVFSKADLVADDDVILPSQFWKIVAWRSQAGAPRAVALVASQQELYEFERHRPVTTPGGATRASEFQVPIAEVGAMTGLDFSAMEPWDTYGAAPRPGEAMRAITDFAAIRLEPPDAA